MPRITGPTIAEHVATQEAAVLDAARQLFAEHGVAAVSLGDIAARVGLGRTSLYRYFPTKAHILQRWFDIEMEPLLARSRSAVAVTGSPRDALCGWLDVQLDFVTDAAHTELMSATSSSGELPPDLLEHFGRRHRELYATLDDVLASGGAQEPGIRRVRARLIAGLVGSAGDLLTAGVGHELVRAELHRAASALAGL